MCLTMWRVAMDEIEFIKLHQKTFLQINELPDGDVKDALLAMLTLINELAERVSEMQVDEDDE